MFGLFDSFAEGWWVIKKILANACFGMRVLDKWQINIGTHSMAEGVYCTCFMLHVLKILS